MIPDAHVLILFMAAALALNLTPGPDMLYVAARSTSEGRRSGILSAFAIATGTLVHIASVALGLTALLAAVPVAYELLRLAGAVYLIYLGIRALLQRGLVNGSGAPSPASSWAVFRQGVLTNVFNPKVALFFLAFLPQFVDPARGPVVTQIVFLGLLFNTSGTLVNVGVALGASGVAARLKRSSVLQDIARKVTGGIFILLGLRLAFGERR
jgi:threonine/homoserine/homoserine lactone efflux protein